MARERLSESMKELLAPFGKAHDHGALARQFADFSLMLAEGAFIAYHIDPEGLISEAVDVTHLCGREA
jgi:hypothetical protein